MQAVVPPLWPDLLSQRSSSAQRPDVGSVTKRGPARRSSRLLRHGRVEGREREEESHHHDPLPNLKYKKIRGFGALVVPKGTSKKNPHVFGYGRLKGKPLRPKVARGDNNIRCNGMKLRRKGDAVRFSAPQRCLGKHAGTVRVGRSRRCQPTGSTNQRVD